MKTWEAPQLVALTRMQATESGSKNSLKEGTAGGKSCCFTPSGPV